MSARECEAARESYRRAALMLIFVLAASGARVVAQECAPSGAGDHAAITVVYGERDGALQSIALSPGDDGTLRAMDSNSGRLLWSFTPPEASAAKAAGSRMTGIRVLRFDADDDGKIDVAAGDRVWLYFGLRNAAPVYYALDISEREWPRVLWKAGSDTLARLGNAWSTPTIARVRIAGLAQNGEQFVLVFGGGYGAEVVDNGQETAGSGAERSGVRGNRVFMVDAATGRLLWSAGAADGSGTPDLALPQMDRELPARVAALDTNSDGFADRLYAADVVGRLWRFDIHNGSSREHLVTGGVLADLRSEGRSFFNGPDVALMRPRASSPYVNIALGSGGPHPGRTGAAHEAFYSIRDRDPFSSRAQSSYDLAMPILPDDLVTVTSVAAGAYVSPDASGWRFELPGAGERVWGESVTVNGVLLFTTFQPSSSADASGCTVNGTTRVYAMQVETATAGLDLNDDAEVTPADLSMSLPERILPGALHVEMPGSAATPPHIGGSHDPDADDLTQAKCLVGTQVLRTCVQVPAMLRTYWWRRSVR